MVIWPKSHTVDIYLDKKDNNHFSFEFDLWQPLSPQDIASLNNFFKGVKRSRTYLILSSDVYTVKSFVYESNIDSINKEEIIAMASPTVDFKIDPEYLTYKLEKNDQKTIIRATFIDNQKIDIVKTNLSKLGIRLTDYQSISDLLVNVVTQFYQDEFCLLYPIDPPQYLFVLAQNNKIYLTDAIKSTSAELTKKINYSELYFDKPAQKLFTPPDLNQDLKLGPDISQNPFDESQISTKLGKSSNIPMPVLSFFDKNLISTLPTNPDIITVDKPINYQVKPEKNMEETKKKIKTPLAIFLVFIVSLVLVSLGLWALINKPNKDVVSPSSDQTTSEDITPLVIEEEFTPTPVPTVTLEKDLKIRVLNATEINGQAATVKTDLTDLGFTDVSTGNSTDDYTVNTVNYKPSLEGVPAYVKQNLASFTQAEFDDNLKETDTYDIIFIVGEKLSSSGPAASSSPTSASSATPSSSTQDTQ